MQIDLLDVMDAYQEKYETSLTEDVLNDTSGDYRNIIETILKGSGEGEAEAVEQNGDE